MKAQKQWSGFNPNYRVTNVANLRNEYDWTTALNSSIIQPGDIIVFDRFFNIGEGSNHVGIVKSADGKNITYYHSGSLGGIPNEKVASNYNSSKAKRTLILRVTKA